MSDDQAPAAPPHAVEADVVVRALDTDVNTGLSTAAAAGRLARYGHNKLAEAPPEPWWRRLARQFADLLIWVLIGAALISGLLEEWGDAAAILAIVILNAILGFVQEGRAEQALASLRRLSSPRAKVVRNGGSQNLPAAELVPGDRIDLEAGDRVPADVRLVGAAGLRVEEAGLTGESVPADKDHREVLDPLVPLGDRVNMAYMGTAVAAGTASAVVVATGMKTEIGHIAGMLQRQGSETTPLQKRLSELGRVLVYVVLGIVLVMFAVQILRGGMLVEAILLSVSLAVAAVPEGLSAVVTVVLALGLQRMARRNALIRRLPSVETLGAVTVICTDKTGTLTRNQMTVREIVTAGRRFGVTGEGYDPAGRFHASGVAGTADEGPGAETGAVNPRHELALLQALTVAAWCSHAQVSRAAGNHGGWELVGDPTEGALIVAAMKAGVHVTDRDHRVVHEIPFNSDRKTMSVVARTGNGPQLFMYTKGAPELVLHNCTAELSDGGPQPLTGERRKEIHDAADAMAARALRVLGLAYREAFEDGRFGESNLIFAGLVGMIDPPRGGIL